MRAAALPLLLFPKTPPTGTESARFSLTSAVQPEHGGSTPERGRGTRRLRMRAGYSRQPQRPHPSAAELDNYSQLQEPALPSSRHGSQPSRNGLGTSPAQPVQACHQRTTPLHQEGPQGFPLLTSLRIRIFSKNEKMSHTHRFTPATTFRNRTPTQRNKPLVLSFRLKTQTCCRSDLIQRIWHSAAFLAGPQNRLFPKTGEASETLPPLPWFSTASRPVFRFRLFTTSACGTVPRPGRAPRTLQAR